MFDVEFELNQLMEEAFIAHTSDIHVAPQRDKVLILFRIDGILQLWGTIAKKEQDKIINRIKIVSQMDIGERRVPQDGRWSWKKDEQFFTLRVSSMPTIWGEKIVIRVLGRDEGKHTLQSLGMTPVVISQVKQILRRPNGLFLVTGPTGSGKSSTLYAILQELQRGEENIICLENPVEYEIPGAVQVEIHEKRGLTFSSGLRASLRQDPDIIMVGEIRDTETAQLAVQAALTGHKVFSTLHTNDAASVVERLIDMEVEPFLVKAALCGALAQRLVRKPCTGCNDVASNHQCEMCHGSGYKGRSALFELLTIPVKGMDWSHIDACVNPTLGTSGLMALREGITTRAELERLGINTNI